MNERIRELAEQAVKAVDNPFPGNPLNDELAKMYIPDCFAEKFAELIVKECMDAVGDGPMQRPEIQRIKAKFGVEYYEPIEKAFRS